MVQSAFVEVNGVFINLDLLNSTKMRPEDSYVELQRYRMLPKDPIHDPAALFNYDDSCIGATSPRFIIDQTLLVDSSGPARAPIKRKPVQSTNSFTKYKDDGTSPSKSSPYVKNNAARDDPAVDEAIVSKIEEAEKAFNGKNDADISLERWSISATNVTQHRRSGIMEICVYVIMAVGAVLFLVFALLSASVHSTYPGTKLKYTADGPFLPGWDILFYSNGTIAEIADSFFAPASNALNLRFLEAAKFGPTVFPILFAGIVTSTIRLIARWRAEKGSTIETLEILIGGRSFASTVSTVFSLHALGGMEIGLVFIWGLSPLAGQASLRVLDIVNVTDATISIPWLVNNNTNIPTLDSQYPLGSRASYLSSLMDAQFVYTNPIPTGATSGVLLLPMTPSNTSWSASNAQSPTNYTSLVGLTIMGPGIYYENQMSSIYGGGFGISYNSTISFPVGGYEFNCPSVFEDLMNGSWTSMLGSNFIYANHSTLIKEGKSGSGFFLDTNATFSSQSEDPQNVIFGSFSNSKVTLWHCLLYVNTRNITIGCVDSGNNIYSTLYSTCWLESMGIPTLSSGTPFSEYSIAAGLFGKWPLADAASPGVSSLTEIFLAQGYTTSFPQGIVDLSELDNITFATRLTTVFNTWIESSTNQGLPVNTTSATPLKVLPFGIVNCNWFFFSILTITSAFLILCCAFSVWLLFQISTPDILGYVSSSTFDNPYVSIPGVRPGSGSALDGIKRAKLLKKVKVQIRDIQPEDEVGKFALTNEVDGFVKPKKNRRFI